MIFRFVYSIWIQVTASYCRWANRKKMKLFNKSGIENAAAANGYDSMENFWHLVNVANVRGVIKYYCWDVATPWILVNCISNVYILKVQIDCAFLNFSHLKKCELNWKNNRFSCLLHCHRSNHYWWYTCQAFGFTKCWPLNSTLSWYLSHYRTQFEWTEFSGYKSKIGCHL